MAAFGVDQSGHPVAQVAHLPVALAGLGGEVEEVGDAQHPVDAGGVGALHQRFHQIPLQFVSDADRVEPDLVIAARPAHEQLGGGVVVIGVGARFGGDGVTVGVDEVERRIQVVVVPQHRHPGVVFHWVAGAGVDQRLGPRPRLGVDVPVDVRGPSTRLHW